MERTIGPAWMGLCILTALAAAALCAMVLKFVATPADYEARRVVLEQKVARAERLAALPGDSAAYPKGAVCEGLDSIALGKVRQTLDEAATAEGLRAAQISWSAPVDTGARVAPVQLSLQVDGPYDKVVSFMDHLGRATPMIFIDTADLNATGVGAQLSLSGKVFCWTRG